MTTSIWMRRPTSHIITHLDDGTYSLAGTVEDDGTGARARDILTEEELRRDYVEGGELGAVDHVYELVGDYLRPDLSDDEVDAFHAAVAAALGLGPPVG